MMRAAPGYVCSGRHHRQDGEMAKWFRVYRIQSFDNMLTGTCADSEWPSRFSKIIIIRFTFCFYYIFTFLFFWRPKFRQL